MLNSRCQCECSETSIRDAAFCSLLALLSNAARGGSAPAHRQLATRSLCPRRAPATAPRCPPLLLAAGSIPATPSPFPGPVPVRMCLSRRRVRGSGERPSGDAGAAHAARRCAGHVAAHGTAQGFGLAAKTPSGLEPAAGGDTAQPPPPGAGREAGAHPQWTLLPRSRGGCDSVASVVPLPCAFGSPVYDVDTRKHTASPRR